MASKPKAPLKSASKATAKVVDDNLSDNDIKNKADFINNHVGGIKPAFAEAVIHQIGGWRFFSLYAHDVAECGVGSGFKGFLKDAECKAFFNDNKKLLKDFYKPKSKSKIAKAADKNDLFGCPVPDMEPPFNEQDIEAVFASKAKAEEIKAAQASSDDDYSDDSEGDDFHELRHDKQNKDITVWLACNAAQQVFNAYAGMHPDRYKDDEKVDVPDQLEAEPKDADTDDHISSDESDESYDVEE